MNFDIPSSKNTNNFTLPYGLDTPSHPKNLTTHMSVQYRNFMDKQYIIIHL